MNRLQINAFLDLIFTTLGDLDKNQTEVKKLRKEARKFEQKHTKNLAKKEEPEDWGLSSKDRAALDKMHEKIQSLGDPSDLIQSMIGKVEGAINDPKLYVAKHEIKSSYSPSELATAINEIEEKHEVVGLSYFTGINEGDLVYCCGIKYLKAPKGK